MEGPLREAMEVKVPDGLASRLKLGQVTEVRRKQGRTRLYAIAAGVLMLLGGVQFAWFTHQFDSFEQSVLAELNAHPELYTRQVAMAPSEMEGEFRKAGLALDGELDNLLAVHYCWIHGVTGLHMVLQGEQGPVRVLILNDKGESGRSAIKDNGQQGFITAVERGSVVFMGESGEPLEQFEQQVGRKVRWL